MSPAIILLTTYPNDGRTLKRLITAILKQWLAKCIQRVNYVKSYYIREGAIKKDEEKLLIIKTTVDLKEKLANFLIQQHPYQVPELIWINPDEVDEKYLSYLNS